VTSLAPEPYLARGHGRRAWALAAGVAQRWVALVVATGCWEVTARQADSVFFPAPSAIAVRMRRLWFSGPAAHAFLTHDATTNIVPSVARLLAGWLFAAVAGISAGVLLGRSPRALDYAGPLIHFFRAIPPPALVPVFIVMFKTGTQMQLATIAFGVIWPLLITSIDGARTVDPVALDTARAFRVSAARRVSRVILPAAAPKVFAGLRVSLSLSLILMVISELLGSTNGIGYELLGAQRNFELLDMWAGIALLGVLGYALNTALLAVERRLLAWHRGARQLADW
jgi:ABC-type nitrate/sulfonate/bicarbonate transport system permease component